MRLLLALLVGPLLAEASILAPIKEVLRYYSASQATDNFLFGVLLAEAQLYATRSISKLVESDVNQLIKMSDMIIVRNPRPWLSRRMVKRVAKALTRMKIKQPKLDPPEPLPYRLEENFLHGPLTKGNSSRCIIEALIGRRVSDKCLEMESSDDARGYSLSHQAVYLDIASAMAPTQFIRELLTRKCGRILSEVNYAWENDIPDNLSDLFVEDVAVCGMSNFQEFLTEPILDYILSLQREEGCFTLSKEGPLRECDDHISSTSLVALTSFLYAVVEAGQYELL